MHRRVILLSHGFPRPDLGLAGRRHRGPFHCQQSSWRVVSFPSLILCPECFTPKYYHHLPLISFKSVSLKYHFISDLQPSYLKLQTSHSILLSSFTSLSFIILYFINLSCLLSISHHETISSTRAGMFTCFFHY